jgi:hypothetical protein
VRTTPANTRGYGTAASALTSRELLLADAIAERVSELLRIEPTHRQLVDAVTVAAALGVSRDCVYAHAAELGGERIGNGPRGRLRFDLDRALAAWTSRCHSKESHTSEPSTPARLPGGRPRQRMGSSAGLLPIKGSAIPADAHPERS